MNIAHMASRSAAIASLAFGVCFAQGAAKPYHDNFYWLGEFNKASTVQSRR